MKIGITGSRKFTDYKLLCSTLNKLTPTEIIAGGAMGADTLAEQYADERNLPKNIFLPKFKINKAIKYHPRYYHMRNRDIVDAADMVLAFWDGKSKGTKSTIDYARETGKPIKIIHFPRVQSPPSL